MILKIDRATAGWKVDSQQTRFNIVLCKLFLMATQSTTVQVKFALIHTQLHVNDEDCLTPLSQSVRLLDQGETTDDT